MDDHRMVRGGIQLFKGRNTFRQMLRDTFAGHYRMSFLTVAIMIFTIGYIIYPHDLIPDRIPLFGWLDDIALVCLSFWRLRSESRRYIRSKVMERRCGEVK
jgi:uncharacterized membrane protein YkvA (DUF1232 family)